MNGSIVEEKRDSRAYLKKAAVVFLYGFFLIKPFYIFGEGTFQIGDLCCMLSFVCLLAYYGTSFKIEKTDLLFMYFVGAVFVINSIYWAIYGMNQFMLYSMYYLYILFGILTFRRLLPDPKILANIAIVLRVGLIIQVVIFVLGLGNWVYTDRYGGTFPDPNRFACYVFFSFLLIKGIGIHLGQKSNPLDDVMAIFLVWLSASVGMLGGIAIYYVCLMIKKIIEGHGMKHFMKTMLVILGIIAAGCVIYANWGIVTDLLNQVPFGRRLITKVSGFMAANSVTDVDSFWEDRAIERIFEHPEYFIFGSGEGNHARFSVLVHEMHSTPLALAYYYGIFPFTLIVLWTVRSAKGTFKNGTWIVLLPLLLESCTLAHQRLLLFWMMIMLAGLVLLPQEETEEERSRSSGFIERLKRSFQGTRVPSNDMEPVFMKARNTGKITLPKTIEKADPFNQKVARK